MLHNSMTRSSASVSLSVSPKFNLNLNRSLQIEEQQDNIVPFSANQGLIGFMRYAGSRNRILLTEEAVGTKDRYALSLAPSPL